MSRPRVHLGYLDGLRAVAALYVVFHHAWQFVVSRPDAVRLPRWFTIFTLLKPGSYGVTVFIVLSGYCLALPVARAAEPQLNGGLADFLKRRARRILPPYFATVTLSIAFLLVNPTLREPTGTQWDTALPALTLTSIASHLALLHNLVESWQWKLNPPLWSVALEWQIYFLFALLIVPLWRRVGLWATLGFALVLGVTPLAWGGGFAHPWFIGSFALGMAAAAVGFSTRFDPEGAVRRVPWGIVAIALCVPPAAAVLLNRRWPIPDVLAELSLSIAVAAFLIRSTRFVENQAGRSVLWALENPCSVKLGSFSYSLYLVHYPLLALLAVLLRPVASALSAFAWLTLLGVPLMLAFSYVFHCVFERPFMSAVARPASDRVHEIRA
jgi:peptidoglycan/LPS O-acetylase OafA/YrhL